MKSQPLTRVQFDLTAASVTAAVLPHLLRMPWLFSIPIALLLAGRWLQRRRGGARIPAWIKLPLIVIFPIFIIIHYGNIFGRDPGSVLACSMLVLKLVETESRRDARAAICFASFVLMSALLFNSSLVFTLLLFAALALFLATLRALESLPAGTITANLWHDSKQHLRGGAIALASALPLALCVFVFLPRLGSPLWGAPSNGDARTGLGDRMAPGSIQQLLIDDSPAFRVDFDGPLPPRGQLYWRGPVLWQFDGSAWTRPEIFASRPNDGGLETRASTISYAVSLEPTQRHWLLALDMPVAAPDNAVRAADMSLVSRTPVDKLRRYRVTSATHYRLDPNLDGAHRNLALRLPDGFDPRSRALAQRWRTQFHDDDGVIHAALAMFNKDFFYTLNAPLLGHNSIDDFLFETRRGFCEHYASAFTFLMRAAGIPARVVTGYQGGYYNASSDYLVVRQSDAHAWSEVWLAGRGWVRVDPTAAVSPQRVEIGARAAAGASAPWYQADWLQAMRNHLDVVNRFWNNAIVQFDALRQRSLLTPFGIDDAGYSQLVAILIGLSTLLLALFAWWVMRAPREHRDRLDAAYTMLCRKLARAGAVRAPNEGPQTFSQRVADMRLNNGVAQNLIVSYADLRYARQSADANAIQAFARAVRKLNVHTMPDPEA
ncbi:MAG: DUF3488 and transglutaminase-like domain-containing protein [Rudaea sp.]